MITRSHKAIPLLILGLLVFLPEVTHADFLQETLWSAVNGIFGTILGLCAWLFDIAINRFVIGFAGEYTTSGIGIAIDGGWALVRDLMNLLFIFGLLYIGFKIILNSDDSRTRSMLVNLVVAALLINFSLFITKFVVDASNGLASQIAISGFYGETIQSPYYPDDPNEKVYQVEMATDVMARMGMSTLYDWDADNPQKNQWGYIFGVAILLIVASFVFLSGAILLLIRFLALNFFMLLSPLMFVGWAFPPLARYTGWYWRAFLGRAFFAPVYFLLIYFSLSIVTALGSTRNVAGNGLSRSLGNDLQSAGRIGDANALTVGEPSTFPYFMISVGAMLFALFAAQKLGADGASTAINIGKNMQRKVQNGVKRGAVGTGRFAARNTAGVALRGGQNVSNQIQRKYQRLDASMAKTKTGRFARGALNVATLGATSDKALQAGFSKVSKARVAGSETYDEYTKRGQEITSRQNKLQKETDSTKNFKNAFSTYQNELRGIEAANVGDKIKIDGQLRPVLQESDKELFKSKITERLDGEIAPILNKMSDEEIKKLSQDEKYQSQLGGLGTTGNIFKESSVAKHLKDTQIKALAESGIFRNEDIKGINDAWGKGNIDDILTIQENVNATSSQLSASIEKLGQNIKNMSKDRLAGINIDTLRKEGVAMHLKKTDLDNLRESGKFSSSEMKSIISARDNALLKMVKDGTHLDTGSMQGITNDFKDEQREKVFKAGAKEVGNYPVAIFKEEATYNHASPEMITERLKNGATKTDIQEMRTALENSVKNGNNPAAWDTWKGGNSTHAAQFFS